MMRRNNIAMTTTVAKAQLLERLTANRADHAKIVAEARLGYIAKARRALADKMDELGNGKLASLHFALTPPEDHTEVYDNAIEMLQWQVNDTVELEADEFRQLVRDQWDWSDGWYANVQNFSSSASAVRLSKLAARSPEDEAVGSAR